MPTWLWILLGLIGLFILWVVFATVFLTPRESPDDDAILEYARKHGLRGSGASLQNPVCQTCGQSYNRAEVIKQLKQQSPAMFDFGYWSTRFRCVTCQAEVEISGSGGD